MDTMKYSDNRGYLLTYDLWTNWDDVFEQSRCLDNQSSNNRGCAGECHRRLKNFHVKNNLSEKFL